MDRVFSLPSSTFIGGEERVLPLREILRRLEKVYCHHIGVEYMFIASPEQRRWLQQQIETPDSMELKDYQRRLILERLTRATLLV